MTLAVEDAVVDNAECPCRGVKLVGYRLFRFHGVGSVASSCLVAASMKAPRVQVVVSCDQERRVVIGGEAKRAGVRVGGEHGCGPYWLVG